MKKNVKSLLTLALAITLTSVLGLNILAANAADLGSSIKNQLNSTAGEVGYNTGANQQDLTKTIGTVINYVLGFLGLVSLVIIIAAGFMWMTAGGSEDKVASAKKLMINSFIGLAIILLAYSISYFVMQSLLNVSGLAS